MMLRVRWRLSEDAFHSAPPPELKRVGNNLLDGSCGEELDAVLFESEGHDPQGSPGRAVAMRPYAYARKVAHGVGRCQ